jgi:putative phosphoserine phosphatase/1-acylglycerol-3-phosphate O-acyltransferase
MNRHQALLSSVESAPEGAQVGALFDVDGTLIAGYSAVEFLKERLRRRTISPQEFLEISGALAQFALGAIGFSDLMSTSARLMRGVSEDEYTAFGEELYRKQIARRVYPESRALVRAHLARGHTVAIVSSATPYQVEPLARDLGIRRVVCNHFEVDDGTFTGETVPPLCFGRGKLDAAEDLARELEFDLDQTFYYGDTIDDIDLLMRVGQPRPLNPDTKLARLAEREGWTAHTFESRGRPGPGGYLRSAAATVSMIPAALAGLPIWALTGSRREGLNFATSLFGEVSSALIGMKLVVRGEGNLWSNRPAVFVFNHQSKADVIIIARLLRRDIASVAKKEIQKNPVIGKTMELAGTVFIDRTNVRSAIRSMRPLVAAMRNEGKCVVMAPEGTRTVSPRLAPFKKGAFHLAMQARVPMVPIVIHNSGDVAPKGEFVMRPATVEVDVLPAIDTSGWTARTINDHVAEVRRLFQRTLGQEEDADPDRSAAGGQVRTRRVGKKKARRKKKPAQRTRPADRAPRKASGRKPPRRKPLKKKALPVKAVKKGQDG